MAEAAEKVLETQYRDLAQQEETAKFGMWIFLITELLLFGGLFISYTVFRFYFPQVFAEESRSLNALIGTINTMILIISSVGVAIAVHGVRTGKRRHLLYGLTAAIILGTAFLVLKAYEYYEHYLHQDFPGLAFDYSVPHALEKQVFFFLYFAMTGLHAIHLTIGIIIVAIVLFLAYRGRFSPEYYAPVENAGLYWHFVDVVWIFLYPLFYLIDLHR